MATAAKFKAGDRVLVRPFNGVCRFGVIETAPKTERGKKYLVRFEGGYILNGKDCPQYLHESFLSSPDSLSPTRGHAEIADEATKYVASDEFARWAAAAWSATQATGAKGQYAMLEMLVALNLSGIREGTLEHQTEAVLCFIAENTTTISSIVERITSSDVFRRELETFLPETQQEAA